MRYILVGLLLLSLSVPAVAAQEAPDAPDSPLNQTETPSDTPEATSPAGERIDNATMLISSSYSERTGMATVTIRSEIPQRIVVSDAGGFVAGGEIEQRSVLVEPGETVEISIPATETESGFVGVSISTQKTLYAVPIIPPGLRLSPPESNHWLAMLVGLLMALLTVVGIDRLAERYYGNGVISVDG